MVILVGFSVIEAEAGARMLPPESTGVVEFHTGWNDQVWHADDYWPAACGVRFPVPVPPGASQAEITVDSIAIGYLPCPGGTQASLTETVSVYTGGNNYPAQHLADFTFTYNFTPGMGYIFVLRPDSVLRIPYEGWPRDTIVVWVVAYNLLYNDGDDTVYVGLDNTAGDPYTSGINFVNEGSGWQDIYTAYGVGYDWIMSLYYTLYWTDAAEGEGSGPGVWLSGKSLFLNLPQGGPLELELFDPAGRLVWKFRKGLEAGRHRLVVPAREGAYFLRVQGPGLAFAKTVVIR